MSDGGSETAPNVRRRVGLFAAPVALALVVALPPPAGLDVAAWRVAGIAILMAVWWITEAIPIPATALVPVVLFPLLGVADVQRTTAPYANPVIFLFLGGFLIAQAMQRWNLHRRVALHILRVLGPRPRNMVGGFMIATAFLSMWVSNTATTVMMLPIGLSVIELTRRDVGGNDEADRRFGIALMLGIAYAASIGGMGTLVGTPPNALLAGFLSETYGVQLGFGQWLAVGLPVVIVMLPVTWLVLTRWIYPIHAGDGTAEGAEIIEKEIEALGPRTRGEGIAGACFCLTALAWVSRPVLARWIPGLSDASIAVAGGLALFVLPVDWRRGVFALDWRSATRLPWGVLLLFGGGLSLASAISRSGLATWLGTSVSGLEALPLFLIIGAVTTVLVFLTELASNTASTAAFLPVLGAVAIGIGENPLLLVVPAALAASCAFMMPVATPPNAIVFSSGLVTISQMARAGIVLNVIFIVAIPLFTYLLVAQVLGAEPGLLPPWAGG